MKATDTDRLVGRLRAGGHLTMTEYESKKLLRNYGVPVAASKVVTSAAEAVSTAKKIGFPVVVKGHGAKLAHKTERGLVKINLTSAKEVREAFHAITAAAGPDGEGCLMAPFIRGNREFVAGLVSDPQFGPVVMFGLGGIFTEVLADTTFRIAPFDEGEAHRMLNEISSAKLLGDFRGEKPADTGTIAKILTGLARLGTQHPEIAEVDINPLIVTPDGQVVAVDALVVLGTPDSQEVGSHSHIKQKKKPARIRAALDVMANARSVAVVGATTPGLGGFAGMFGCMRNFGYRGRLYPVNPRLTEIDGLKAYPDLAALPEKVDLVIISVPGPLVPDILRQCAATGNKNIHIFSSGFKETGEDEGVRLQEEMEQIALANDLNVVGPNCMGFYVPENRLLTWEAAPKQSGAVSLISQSGGNAQDFSNYLADKYRIYINKSISYGNALTLDSTDFLDYLGRDKKTGLITMYLEGVKDGPLLVDLTTKINRRKPVIIYKSGLTESGARAVSSHTGSLAGAVKIWEAFFRQTGATQVGSLEEMADVVQAFHRLGRVGGHRTTVLGFGGGIGVSVADSCAAAGLELPSLSEKLTKKLRKLIPPAGAMIRNPIDAAIAFAHLPILSEVLDLIASSGEIDNFVVSVPFDWLYNKAPDGGYYETIASYLTGEARKYLRGKPMLVVWRQYEANDKIRRWIPVFQNTLMDAGIAVYEGLPRAVSALAKVADYYKFHKDRR